MSIRNVTVALLLAASTSSCAAFRTNYVPDDYSPSQELQCTDDSSYVVQDYLAGPLLMLAPIGIIEAGDPGTEEEKVLIAPFVLAGVGIILTAAIISETDYIQDCKHAKITRRGWLDRDAMEGLKVVQAGDSSKYNADHPVTKSVVSEVLKEAKAKLDLCAENESIRGDVSISLYIRRSKAELAGTDAESEPFRECVAALVASWTFPNSDKPRKVSVPLSFSATPSPGDTPSAAPPADGTSGGACYGNGTCNAGLVCVGNALCEVAKDKSGHLGGVCYGNGTCNSGLECNMESSICEATTEEAEPALKQ